MELVESAPSLGALGATISGAGPTVLVWVRSSDASAVAARLEGEAAGWARVMALPFAERGVEVARTSAG
jgi:homoserine kinase